MKHQWTILLVGLLLMALPFLGFPQSFDYTVMFFAGLFFFIRSMIALKHHYGSEADVYVPPAKDTIGTMIAENQVSTGSPSHTEV